jgi:thioesterase domain-containing protein
VALFLAQDRPGGETADAAALWRPLAGGGLEVDTVPGDHFSLLREPAVEALAAKLQEKLAQSAHVRFPYRNDTEQRGTSNGNEPP